jgi:hypothetical protein
MLQKSMCQEHRINCFQLVVSHFRIEKLELLPVVVDVQVLYHVLGCVPQYQARVVPLLNELCKGLEAGDLAEALGGVYSEHAHVRCACLNAVMHVPALSKQAAPEDSNVATTLWVAQYDSEMVSLFVLFEHQNFTFI